MATRRRHIGQRRRSLDEGPPSWGERLRAMRNLPPFLRMVWRTHRGYTAGILLLRLVRAFVPILSLWVGKLIVDAVVEAIGPGAPDWERLAGLVALEFGIVAAGEIAARTGTLLESLLGDLFSNHMSVRLMEHAATLDLQHFEDPDFYDRLERARRQTVGRLALLSQMLGLAQDALTLLTLVGTLLAFSPLLFVLLLAAVLPSFLGETHHAALKYSLLYQWTPERRKLDYYRYIAASDRTAKEVKLFGLSRHLTDQYAELADRFYQENRRLAVRRNLVGTALAMVSTLGYYAAYATIVYRTVLGALTLGDLTLLSGSFARSRDLIQRMLLTTSDLYEQALYLDDLFEFLAMRPRIARPANPAPGPAPRPRGVRVPGRVVPVPRGRRAGARAGGRGARARLGPARRLLPHPPGRALGAGRRERGGQDHADQAGAAPLRADPRRDPAGRAAALGVRSRRVPPRGRRDLPGLRALRHGRRGEHRGRPDRRAGGGAGRGAHADRGRGRALAGRGRSRAAARALPYHARPALRGRGRPVRRAVAEGRARARLPARRAGADPRRADRRAGRAR